MVIKEHSKHMRLIKPNNSHMKLRYVVIKIKAHETHHEPLHINESAEKSLK